MTDAQTPPTEPDQTPPSSDDSPDLPDLSGLSDLSNTETIYTTKVVGSIQIRLSPKYLPISNGPLYIHSPEVAYQVLQAIYATLDQDQEHFIMIALSGINEVRCYKVVASGGHYFVATDLHLICRTALLMGANRLVVAHNHPAEWLVPTSDDLVLTETLVVAGQILDITVCDHIIYGEKDFTSIRAFKPKLFEEEGLER